jgi:large subunit ribosomal protein L32
MAVQKRKWSKARTGKRRSQWKLSAPSLVECPHCNELKLLHRVCKACGHYTVKNKGEKKSSEVIVE